MVGANGKPAYTILSELFFQLPSRDIGRDTGIQKVLWGNAVFRQFLKMHLVHPPKPQVNTAVGVFVDRVGVHARLDQQDGP